MAKKSPQENQEQKQPEWLKDYKNIGTVLISKSLYSKYIEYLWEIDSLIRKNSPIPASLAKRFFALQQTDSQIAAKKNKAEIRKKSKVAIEKTIAYFENRKGYLFAGKSIQSVFAEFDILAALYGNEESSSVKYKDVQMPYSFKEMIANSIHSFLISEILLSYTNNQAIRFFYDKLTDYYKRLNKAHKKDLTHYRRGAVAAYLTISVGRILFDPSIKSFAPKDLFHVANNALRPPKTKA